MIIAEFRARNGVRVQIADDDRPPRGSEADRRAWEATSRVIEQIWQKANRQAWEAMQAERAMVAEP